MTTTSVYDHHDKLTSAGSKSYGYDSNGNCTTVTVGTSVTTLTYDIENRVVGIAYPGGTSNSFAYNGEDLRTKKVDSTGTQNYVTDGDSPGSALLKDGNAVYTPGLSEHRGSASKFYHSDALGSTRGITDSTQAVTDSVLYDAFGNTVTRTGTTPTPFGFVGKDQYQSDSDSGLQLLGHRYYDPSIGRFLSSDPAKAGTNWYAYCDDNPLRETDAQGLDGTGQPIKLPPYNPPSIIPPYINDPSWWFGPGSSGPTSGSGTTNPGETSGSITVGVGDVGGHPSGTVTIGVSTPGGIKGTGSVTGIGTSSTSGSAGIGYSPPRGFGGTGTASGIGTSNTTGGLSGSYGWGGGNSITGGLGGFGSGTVLGNGGYSHNFGGGWSLGGSVSQIGSSNTYGNVTIGTPGGNITVGNLGNGRAKITYGIPIIRFK